MNNKYKWRLIWPGRTDTEALRSAVEHCKSTFALFRDSEARLIDHNEYQALICSEEIAPEKKWWRIRENQFGLISLSAYSNYENTWDKISLCQGDFLAGWEACEAEEKV